MYDGARSQAAPCSLIPNPFSLILDPCSLIPATILRWISVLETLEA